MMQKETVPIKFTTLLNAYRGNVQRSKRITNSITNTKRLLKIAIGNSREKNHFTTLKIYENAQRLKAENPFNTYNRNNGPI